MEDIENLLNEDLSSQTNDGVIFSNIYKVIKGGFDFEGVETYLGSAYVSQLCNDIEVFEKLTEDKSWPVSSIIQRDVDEKRVKDIAENFILMQSNNVKYFPPIVVAIVPRESSEEISKEFAISADTDNTKKEHIRNIGGYNEKLNKNFINSKNLSDLKGFYVLDWFQGLGQLPLCWDKEKIYAIVIDGQHRLEALKYAMSKKVLIGKHTQDVVFLDLSKKANKEGRSPVEAIRRIFIDINYNAKPVTNARRTLMDDKDLSSLIVQSLVNDDDPNNNRKEKFLAPQLVDWHSENLKHSFPLLTGVLVLQQLIEDNFLQGSNLASILDLRDAKKVGQFVNTLNSRFLVDNNISTKTKYEGIELLKVSHDKYKELIEKQIDIEDKEDLLFNMDYNVLNVARDSFEAIYSKSMVKFFNEFHPYSKAITILKDNSIFDCEDKRNRIIVKNPKKWILEEKVLMDNLRAEMVKQLDDKYYLCFTVLGQKAFFRHYYKELLSHLQSNQVSEATVSEFTSLWLKTINLIIEKLENTHLFSNDQKFTINAKILNDNKISEFGLIASSFWQGIIYNEQNIIYNNQGIEAFVGLINYLYKCYPIKKVDDEIIFPDDSIWTNISYGFSKVKRKIQQQYPDYETERVGEIASIIWKTKLIALKNLIEQNL
ncbi:DNA sulfur modification protein DndB [Flavobacterium tegetincola]|uniref:DNA sulfur modification protein DndB n=1 Tax=Flavobacterium tegetincola TaxID=150172 RepID=UPI000414760B|nr:DNA sulfur modification protein DndB [Flavobacterium tegetincola]